VITLLWQAFVLHHHCAVGTRSRGKITILIDFVCLNFTFYLKKKIVLFYVLWCQLSAKQNVWSLPLEKKKKHCFTRVHLLLVCRATCDKKALARPIVSLVPGYRTAFLSCPEKGTVHVPFFLQAVNFSWSTRVNGMW